MAISMVEPYYERFLRIKEEQGLSWTQLVRNSESVSLSTLRAFAMPPNTGDSRRWRYPSAETIADVAQALGISPEEFPEYQLAQFRARFDERAVGLDEALRLMQEFEEQE